MPNLNNNIPNSIGTVIEDETSPSFDIFKFQSNQEISSGSFVVTPINKSSFILGHVVKVLKKTKIKYYEADALEQGTYSGKEYVFHEPRDAAVPGMSVNEPSYSIIAGAVGIESSGRAILLGEVGGGKAGLNPQNLSRHMFIGGTTGSGKSYAAGVILEELNRLEIPAIILDSQQEYKELTEGLNGLVVRPGIDYTVSLSSLTDEESVSLASSLRGTLGFELFNFSFLALKKEIQEGRRQSFNLTDLLKRMESDAPSLGMDGYQMRLAVARADASIRRHEFLRTIGKNLDWQQVIKKKTINIDCSRLELLQLQLVVGATLREMQKLRFKESIPPYVVVLDEAHLLVPSEENSPCKQVIRENVRIGRHYGICAILITQNPLDIDRRTISQCNTRLIFALEPDQLSALQGVRADITENMFKRIPKLPRGVCLVSGTYETVKHAVVMKIRSDRKTKHGGDAPKIVRSARY